MKINREARREARKLFRVCFVDGRLDEGRTRLVVKTVAERKPRFCLAILERLKILIEIEVEKRTFSIESAVALADQGDSIFRDLQHRFGPPMATRYQVNPALLGGVSLRVGSHIWDGSVRERLRSIDRFN